MLDSIARRNSRKRLHKTVCMIRHNFQSNNVGVDVECFFQKKQPKSLLYASDKYFPAIFRKPNQAVSYIKNSCIC